MNQGSTNQTHQYQPYTLKSIANSTIKIPDNSSQNKYYEIKNIDGFVIRIYFMTHSIIRVRMSFDKKNNFCEQSYSLVMTAWNDRFDELLKNYRKKIVPLTNVSFQYKQNDGSGSYYYFQTWEMKVKIYDNPYGIEIQNKNGNVIYKDLRGRAYRQDLRGRVYHYSKIDIENDCFYGFGQNTGKLNKSGCRVRLDPQDALGYDAQNTSALYKHIPFYVKVNKKNKHAIGLFYHNTFSSTFDMGSEKNGYWEPYSYYCAEGGDIDLFIINGPTIKKAVQKYMDLTGKTAFTPLQSLGYIGSSMYYAQLQERCDLAITSFIKKCNKLNIPISNFHLSSGYTVSQNKQAPKRYVFQWNNLRFPNPISFFYQMKELGVSVSPNVKPGVLTTHPLYEELSEFKSFVKDPQSPLISYIDRWWGGDGSFIDFTNPQTREKWKNMLKDYLILRGATSIWNDNNQYSSIDNGAAKCTYDYEKGSENYGIIDQLRVVQSLLMAHASEQALKQEGKQKRTFIITRGACAGMQRYASSWSGDNYTSWSTLKGNISTILNIGMSGFANYGCDIGGFFGPSPSPELFLRWVQHGIFQPRFSIHSCNSDNTITQPWMFPQLKDIIAKTIRFRYMLLPYLYSLLYYSHIRGRLIARALAYEFQDYDFVNCANESEKFMLGPYLLVAGVLDPMSKLSKKDKRKQINKIINKNDDYQNENKFDFTGFPIINYFVPNCVDLNEIKEQKMEKTKERINNDQYGFTSVYLPSGCNWYSWNGRDRYQGGQTIQIKVNLDSIPLLVRDKSIIPLAFKFGKNKKFDILDMNKQMISGLYIKIAYENEAMSREKVSYSVKQKNFVEFIMYQDDGISIMDKGKEKEKVYECKLNEQIADDASFLLTKINIKHPIKKVSQKDKKKQNRNVLFISVTRQGNLSDENICTVNAMILEIKSVDKSPIWIALNGNKCKQVRDQIEWMKWKQELEVQKQNTIQKSLLVDENGCWYYDYEKGAAVLKISKSIVRPSEQNMKKYRNFEIYVCKDPLINFSKQYEKVEEEMSEGRIETVVSQDQIGAVEQKINEGEVYYFNETA